MVIAHDCTHVWNEWGSRRWPIFTYTWFILEDRPSICEVEVLIAGNHTATHTYTPSWVPLLFLPPWRRGHWHDFLSLVSLIESRSLFSGQTSQSRAAWPQNLCFYSSAPLFNNLPHLNRQHLITQYTETYTRQRSPLRHKTARQKHAQSSLILQVTFWLEWFTAFRRIPFKARFLNRVFRQRQTGSRFALGENQ